MYNFFLFSFIYSFFILAICYSEYFSCNISFIWRGLISYVLYILFAIWLCICLQDLLKIKDCYFTSNPECLFVCLFEDFRPNWEILIFWRRHHYRWRAANFDLCLALMTIEHWRFFSVSHLLRNGTSIYSDTHTSCREYGSRADTTCLNDLSLSQLGLEHTIFR